MSEVEGETHYVRSSKRQRGYYRRKPYTYDNPTKAQRKTRAALARTAFEKGRDKTGMTEITDERGNVKEVPSSAIPILEELRGMQVKPLPLKIGPPMLSPLDRLRREVRALIRSASVPPSSE